MVEKKTAMKASLVGLAALALIIGLSVGLTQRNQNRSASASSAMEYEGYGMVDDECEEPVTSAKSGKSMSYASKSSKSADEEYRRLVVPGTEGYAAGPEKRRKLRTEIARDLGMTDDEGTDDELSSKGSKSGDMSVSSKGSKSGDDASSKGSKSYCPTPEEICGSGKSGKGSSGGGSGKSGKGMSYDGSTPAPSLCESTPSPTGAKSVKSAKSTPSPTTPKPTKEPTPEPTKEPDCECEDIDRKYLFVDGQCIFAKCDVDCSYYDGEVQECADGFDTAVLCCDYGFGEGVDCQVDDLCPAPIEPEPTFSPTSGSTPTVGTSTTSDIQDTEDRAEFPGN